MLLQGVPAKPSPPPTDVEREERTLNRQLTERIQALESKSALKRPLGTFGKPRSKPRHR